MAYKAPNQTKNIVYKNKPVTLTLPPAHSSQYEFITYFDKHPECRFLVGACGSKWGKLINVNTKVPTTKGWTTVGELKEGDYLFDIDGKPTLIEYITDVTVPEKAYRVTFSDGNYVDACSDHLWEVKSHLCRKAEDRVRNPKERHKFTNHKPEVLTTQQIKDNLYYTVGGKTRPNYTIDLCGPAEFPEQSLPIDPYLFGAWLGDGHSMSGCITCDDKEQSVIDNIRNLGFIVAQDSKDPQKFKVEGLLKLLKDNNLLGKENIPEPYRIGSVQQRLSLLQGLMDTDGTIGKDNGYCTFDNTNILLADLVAYLAQSLGIKVQRSGRWGKLNGVKKKWCYRVQFKTELNVFRMTRKLQYLGIIPKTIKSTRRTIVEVEEIPATPMKCIRVDNPRHLFLITEAFIPTHNTMGCCMLMIRMAWEREDSLNWWVSPTYDQADNALNTIIKLLPPDTFKAYVRDRYIEILTPAGKIHSTIVFKSAQDPETLRGYAVHFVIIDEAAYVNFKSYESVMTTLTQTKGKMVIISTPKGRGWFYDVFMRGQKLDSNGNPKYTKDNPDPHKDYFSMNLPTHANPTVTREILDDFKKNMPEDSYRQEIVAEFLSDSAGVFRGIKDCIRSWGPSEKFPNPPDKDKTYTIGLDLARINDFTVITVLDNTQNVVCHQRFNKVDWEFQTARVKEVATLYNNALVVVDSTGVGDPITQSLQKMGLRVLPYKINSNIAKKQLIDKLKLAIEKNEITFPPLPELVKELENYEYTVADNNTVKYSAPRGEHDDCVISLALANWAASKAPFKYKQHSVRGI